MKKSSKHVLITTGDWNNNPRKLTVWKTIPFVEDICVSGTDAVLTVCGLR